MPKLGNLIIIAASIFIFLFILGIISGNAILTVFGRAFLGTALFSGILLGAHFIFKRILPEDSIDEDKKDTGFEDETQQPDQNYAETSGKNVDIVLEGENPFSEEQSISGNDFEKADNIDNDQDIGTVSQKPPSSGDNLVEEVIEDSLGDISALDTGKSSDVVEIIDDSQNIDKNMADGNLPPIDLDPDLLDARENGNESSASKRENAALNSLGDNLNPEIMAKAIKTVLTRDSKG